MAKKMKTITLKLFVPVSVGDNIVYPNSVDWDKKSAEYHIGPEMGRCYIRPCTLTVKVKNYD